MYESHTSVCIIIGPHETFLIRNGEYNFFLHTVELAAGRDRRVRPVSIFRWAHYRDHSIAQSSSGFVLAIKATLAHPPL